MPVAEDMGRLMLVRSRAYVASDVEAMGLSVVADAAKS